MWWLASVLFACGGTPTWSACTDGACRQALMVETFRQDPERVLETLPALDPSEQAVLVDTLSRGAPELLDALCRRLPHDGPTGQRCQRIKDRPHLAAGERAHAAPPPPRRASGPASSHLPPPAQPSTPVATTCPDTGGEAAHECRFREAERTVEQRGAAAFSEALAHCAAAGPFQTPCIEHVLALALPPIPPADRLTVDDVATIVAAIAKLRDAAGEQVGHLYEDQAWARWATQAYAGATDLSGELLDHLPPAAAPHVRMAVALRITAVGDSDLDRWSRELRAALSDRQPLAASPTAGRKAHLVKGRDFWPEERPGETTIPAVFCLGPGRRPVAQDPGSEALIVLLEAAARRAEPPEADFFLGFVGSEHPELVRWTAARLAEALEPGLGRARELPDPSPLVRGRLHGD